MTYSWSMFQSAKNKKIIYFKIILSENKSVIIQVLSMFIGQAFRGEGCSPLDARSLENDCHHHSRLSSTSRQHEWLSFVRRCQTSFIQVMKSVTSPRQISSLLCVKSVGRARFGEKGSSSIEVRRRSIAAMASHSSITYVSGKELQGLQGSNNAVVDVRYFLT